MSYKDMQSFKAFKKNLRPISLQLNIIIINNNNDSSDSPC